MGTQINPAEVSSFLFSLQVSPCPPSPPSFTCSVSSCCVHGGLGVVRSQPPFSSVCPCCHCSTHLPTSCSSTATSCPHCKRRGLPTTPHPGNTSVACVLCSRVFSCDCSVWDADQAPPSITNNETVIYSPTSLSKYELAKLAKE